MAADEQVWFLVLENSSDFGHVMARIAPDMGHVDLGVFHLEKQVFGVLQAHDVVVDVAMDGAERLEVDIIQVEARDAAKDAPGEGFDIVLADAPCSGFGTVRKKPEIRYKPLASVAALPSKQLAILTNLADAVKPGGTLVYSTCTLIKEENEGVTDAFLAVRPDFEPEAFELPGVGRCEGRVTLIPGKLGTDGFYICRMRRKKI